MSTQIKIRDLQFAKYLLTHEIDLDDAATNQVLEHDIEISNNGEPDSLVDRGNSILVHNPTSVTRFLFNVLYMALSKFIREDIYRDKLGLGLLFMCKEYVYSDFEPEETRGPPVLIDFNKLPVPAFIIKKIIEPIVGTINTCPLFFAPCKFTDACREINSADQLTKQYNLPRTAVGYGDFPLVLCNTNIHNDAALLAHITFKEMELCLGGEKAGKVLRGILLDKSSSLLHNLVLVLKMLRGEPDFVLDFLKYFGSHVSLSQSEMVMSSEKQHRVIAADAYLRVKIARETQITKQWSQWSMLMGLIEKQLTPMRGSMWPSSETIKPFEDKFRDLQNEKAHSKGSQLNFEELLESYRDLYNHKSIEPGKIVEFMLKDNRVWK